MHLPTLCSRRAKAQPTRAVDIWERDMDTLSLILGSVDKKRQSFCRQKQDA